MDLCSWDSVCSCEGECGKGIVMPGVSLTCPKSLRVQVQNEKNEFAIVHDRQS